MEYIVETKDLTKKFPNKLAVDHVSMHIARGDIYGFIGKNGAGKTTTMKLLLGLLRPTSGEMSLFGSTKLDEGRIKIGSLIEEPGLYKNCDAIENMNRFAILNGGDVNEIKEILDLVGLSGASRRKVREYSLGMKQRLGIAISLLGHPDLLILDEPINGLDPAGIKEIRDTILKLNKEKGVSFLISSHILDELAKITTRYGIINDGRLVEEIEADVLNERCQTNLKISVDNVKKAESILKENNLLNRYEINDHELVMFDHYDEAAKINELLVKGGVKVNGLSHSDMAFEDYFIERIGR